MQLQLKLLKDSDTDSMARHHSVDRNCNAGFTITELMIAASLGAGLAVVVGQLMVTHIQSNARSESLQRQREDWKRTTSFIESEIAMSSRIFTAGEAVSIPATCNLKPEEIRLALDLPRDLPIVLYGIKKLNSTTTGIDRSQWLGEGLDDQNLGLLIRCGPNLKITKNGTDDYDGAATNQAILIDGVDTTAPGEGLHVKIHDAKSASFSLALKGLTRSRFIGPPIYFGLRLGSGSYSRINPIANFPEESSACNRLCGIDEDGKRGCQDIGSYYVVPVSTTNFDVPYEGLTANDNITVCSLIPNASINGGSRSDVIDGLMPSPTGFPGVNINGGDGRNVLFGTPGPDTLKAGSGDDVIVGRGGSDSMDGGNGNNSYSPWPSLNDPSVANLSALKTTTITGGSGLDIFYLRGNKNEFSGISNCSKSSGCTITPADASIKLSLKLNGGIDVLVFKDARIDLP
jgi:hypothetical protein